MAANRAGFSGAVGHPDYCPRSLTGGPLGHCGTLPQKPSQNCCPTPCSHATRLKKLSPAQRAIASLICCQRSGCAVGDGVRPCAVTAGASVVEGDNPGAPGGLLAFVGGALLESIVGAAWPVALVGPGAVRSLAVVASLADESGAAAGADFVDTASWAGGLGTATTFFGGSGTAAGSGAVEVGITLVAARLGDSLGKSTR